MRRGRWTAIALLLASCGGFAPMPTPPGPSFQMLVDVGVFGGPPAPPPDHTVEQLTDDTLLLLVDRGGIQLLREVRWAGARWESLGGSDLALFAVDDQGPALRVVNVGPDDGLSTEAVILVGRVPNGPVNQLELEVDGELVRLWIQAKPASLYVFPPGTRLGTEFQALDAGTKVLEIGPVEEAP